MFRKRLDAFCEKHPRCAAVREWVAKRRRRLKIAFAIIMHLLGIFHSVQAVMSTRTPQGAIAWVISLNTCPYIAVPAYWIFGHSHFDGYHIIRRSEMLASSETKERAIKMLKEGGMLVEPETPREKAQAKLLQNLAKLPLTRHNDVDLLIDGEETFDAIFKGIAGAKEYVLVQFYILRDDDLGRQLQQALIKKAREGVRIYVLYDELGSHALSDEYKQQLRDAGASIEPFNTTKGSGNRLRLNFRNHRKIVVVDGKEAFVGGHNVGDEYVGKHPTLTPWRDTHVAVRGPVVLEVQVAFVEDWKWATDSVPPLNWKPEKAPKGDAVALCLPSGPADEFETATLFFLNAINSAQERVWIVSPYFVPDEQLMSALKLASLRGVDVRILIPKHPDQTLVHLSSYSYLVKAEKAGIKIFRYTNGFLHQKVMLVDDRYSAVGTANFDNRSMRLNFEITMMFVDADFAKKMETMLKEDFNHSKPASAKEYTDRSFLFRFSVRAARLLAPVQ